MREQFRQSQGRAGLAGCFLAIALFIVCPAQAAVPPVTVSQVEDINPGAADSDPRELTAIGDVLYFDATKEGFGGEPWTSDGTEAGTDLLLDIATALPVSASIPHDFVQLDGFVLFAANEGASGGATYQELWISDGTPGGTEVLKDIYPGVPNASNPQRLTKAGDRIFFFARDSEAGYDLWKTNGTLAGTVKVKDLDGVGAELEQPVAVGEDIFFAFVDGDGRELWTSDGSASGTEQITDLNPGSDHGIPNNPLDMIAYDGSVFFRGNDGTKGVELWRGDVAGTERITDIAPDGASGLEFTADFETYEGDLYFVAASAGRRIFKTDGTVAGTEELTCPCMLNPGELTASGGTLYFVGWPNQLWKTDGTAAGQEIVKEFDGSNALASAALVDVAGNLFFSADESALLGPELWRSDGTTGGTVEVADLSDDVVNPLINTLTPLESTLFFRGADSADGIELWKAELDIPTCRGELATIQGDESDDLLIGTAGDDVIAGLDGDDVINGLGGDDVICGGDGNDEIAAGGGDDFSDGGDGRDKITMGRADDLAKGGKGKDTIKLGGGSDTGKGGDGGDIVHGQGGPRDRSFGDAGADKLKGGAGSGDKCKGGGGKDTASGSCERISQVP